MKFTFILSCINTSTMKSLGDAWRIVMVIVDHVSQWVHVMLWRCVKFSYYCVIGKDTHGKWEISSRPPWSRMSHCWISWVNWFKNIIWSILCAISCHKSVEKCFCVCHCEVLIIDCIQIYKGLLLIITLNI